jgi:hypothetical protein
MREPNFSGYAKGWKTTWQDDRPDSKACIGQYIIEGAFHPFWSQWVIACVSLADFPGAAPAKKHHPDNTHEFLIIAVDPKQKLDPDVVPTTSGYMLQPIDLIHQVKLPDDKDAADILELMVRSICDGKMSPDQDYRSAWKEIINNTVAHAYGAHSTKQ